MCDLCDECVTCVAVFCVGVVRLGCVMSVCGLGAVGYDMYDGVAHNRGCACVCGGDGWRGRTSSTILVVFFFTCLVHSRHEHPRCVLTMPCVLRCVLYQIKEYAADAFRTRPCLLCSNRSVSSTAPPQFAGALATVLQLAREVAEREGGLVGVELLRKESLAGLAPAAAAKVGSS